MFQANLRLLHVQSAEECNHQTVCSSWTSMRRVHRDTRDKDQFMSESFTALVKISNPVAKLLWRLNIPGVCKEAASNHSSRPDDRSYLFFSILLFFLLKIIAHVIFLTITYAFYFYSHFSTHSCLV